MGVVEVALVIVAEYLVGLGDFFELDLGYLALVFGDFVGVVTKGSLNGQFSLEQRVARWRFTHLTVSLLDLVARGCLIDREQLCES